MTPNSHFKELLSALNSAGVKYSGKDNYAEGVVANALACRGLVGRTPWSAAGPLAGFLRRSTKADEGVGRGPGGPPDSITETLIFVIRCLRRRTVKSFLREP